MVAAGRGRSSMVAWRAMARPEEHRNTPRADVIVVGGGPAGSHLALRLLRAGRRVVLLDKRRFPRPKPCGEFLGPECLPLLEELGLLEETAAAGAEVRGMRLVGHGRETTATFDRFGRFAHGPRHGLAVRRERLDTIALEAVRARGGDVREEWSVSDLVREGGRVAGVRGRRPDGEPFELRAPFTAGADGLRGRTARALGGFERIRWLDHMALSARARTRGLRGRAEVHFDRGAYLAIAPVGGGWATLNAVVPRAWLGGGASPRELIEERIARSHDLATRLEPLPADVPISAVGPLAWRARRVVADGIALVGDACGYVDPMTGEGLYYAMRGAERLAHELVPALARGRVDARSLARYARSRREFAHRRTMALALQRVLPRPRLARAVLALLERRPGLAHLALGMTGRAIAPRALIHPALWREALAADDSGV